MGIRVLYGHKSQGQQLQKFVCMSSCFSCVRFLFHLLILPFLLNISFLFSINLSNEGKRPTDISSVSMNTLQTKNSKATVKSCLMCVCVCVHFLGPQLKLNTPIAIDKQQENKHKIRCAVSKFGFCEWNRIPFPHKCCVLGRPARAFASSSLHRLSRKLT